jgi:hypothetical protein
MAARMPREIIREKLPLRDVPADLADQLVEDCFDKFIHDPSRRDLMTIIEHYKILMKEATQ